MKKPMIPIMASIILFIFAGYVEARMPNPTTVYCGELGYQVETITEEDGGQYSICVFPDGNTCDSWKFMQGTCGEEYSYCAKNGYGQIVKTDGKNPFSGTYAICVDGSTEIGNPLDLMGITERLSKKSPSEYGLPPISPSPEAAKPVLEGMEQQEGVPPPTFDWRTYNGFDWMTPVKDQAACGSCWAFGSVGTVEAVYNLHQNQPNLDINLSEEYVNTDCNGNGRSGCCGGRHEYALDAIRVNGVPDDACLVYDVATYNTWPNQPCLCDAGAGGDECRGTCPNGGGTTTMCSLAFCDDACFDVEHRLVKIEGYHDVGDSVDDIKAALISHGPLTTALNFTFAGTSAGGVFYCNDGNSAGTNHCVIITGWDDNVINDNDPTHLGAWIIKNSWGNNDQGDGYRLVSYDDCSIQGRAVWVQAKADTFFPSISIPNDITFYDTCVNETSLETLNICNTGKADLLIYEIASNNAAQFQVTEPLLACTDLDGDGIVEAPDECTGGEPANISPDFCYPFEIQFTPTSTSTQMAELTVRSSDIGRPSITVDATGNGTEPEITTSIANSGDFGDVCVGEFKDLNLTINNSGDCDLNVTGISSTNTQFQISSGFTAVIGPGASQAVPVRFAPTTLGGQNATITIASNDPDNPSTTVAVSGFAPAANIETSIANSGDFGNVCVGVFKDIDLTINNSGSCDLNVTSISSSDAQFIVPTGFTAVIGPGASQAVPVRFAPATLGGGKNANISIASNDPDTPTATVSVSGTAPPGDIRVTGSTDFGDVCAEEQSEKSVSVCNVGLCNLNVASASVDCADFTLINNPFTAPVSPDSCLELVVRFTPTSDGPKECDLTIVSDDPETPTVTETLTANTPLASIDVPLDQGFPPTVIQEVDACSSYEPFPVSNTGICNLTITALSISTNPDEFSLSGLPSFPIILKPGDVAGAGDLNNVFAPDILDRERTGVVSVTYVSEPVTGDTTTVTRALCGEGVRTGARVLVTNGGTPIPQVKSIKLQRIGANRNKNRLDTLDNARNLALQMVTQDSPCASFQYHREYATVSNPIQLAPGTYQITVAVRIDGKNRSKTVGFDVSSCDFNPTIIVDF